MAKNQAQGKATGFTLLLGCNCQHAFQDERYGRGIRVHNAAKEGNCRCTVCGRVRPRSG